MRTVRRHQVACVVAIGAIAAAFERSPQAQSIAVKRLQQNPLVTVDSSPTLGVNVNGPTVIRVPDWVERPLGRYYMYFGNHRGDFIRLAYADAVTGPWKVHAPGVLHARDTAFFRPQPDPQPEVMLPGGYSTHLASPEILIDDSRKRIILWSHGWYTNGERWPVGLPEARAWSAQKGYGQFTQVAESSDGVHFTSRPALTKDSYLRVFQYGGYWYGMMRLGILGRAKAPLDSFELGGNPFKDSPYANRVRHVALAPRGNRLQLFFTVIGDAPERIMFTTIDLTKDWSEWRAAPAIEVMRPETDYECASAPIAPSQVGDVMGRVHQMRDPHVFQDGGRTYLFYAVCGEQGVAGAEIVLPS
jgi:hypothetical protein